MVKLTTTLLTTTLRLVEQHCPLESLWEHLARHLGPHWPDDRPIALASILEIPYYGIDSCLWLLRAVPEEQAAARDRLARLFACWCARQLWDQLTDPRSRTAVEVAERFAHGEATKAELRKARKDAGRAALTTEDAELGNAACAAAWTTREDVVTEAATNADRPRRSAVLHAWATAEAEGREAWEAGSLAYCDDLVAQAAKLRRLLAS